MYIGTIGILIGLAGIWWIEDQIAKLKARVRDLEEKLGDTE